MHIEKGRQGRIEEERSINRGHYIREGEA